MNRIVISVISLILVFSIAAISLTVLDNSCRELAEMLDEIEQCAIDHNTEKSSEMCKKAVELWRKNEVAISLLIDHREIDEIEDTIKSLPVYARQDDMEKLEEKASIAAERVRHIRDKEKISLENVF